MNQSTGGGGGTANRLTETKPESFKIDQQYRSARRNLIWTSVAAVLFTFARPTTELYEFSFSSLGVGAGFHRAAFAAGLTCGILFLGLRFLLETRRIIITLNSDAAVNARGLKVSEQEYSSEHISNSFIESLQLTNNSLQECLNNFNSTYTVIEEIEHEFNKIKWTRQNFLESRQKFNGLLSDFQSVYRSLERFEENPLQFYPTEKDVSEILILRTRIKSGIAQIEMIFNNLYQENNQVTINERLPIEIEEKIMRISSILNSFDIYIKRVELLTINYESILQKHADISKKIRCEEKLSFYVLDQFMPYSLALFGVLGCTWWIVAWWQA